MFENKAGLFNQVKQQTGRVNVDSDFGMVNINSKASVISKEDGNLKMITDEITQFTMDKQSNTIIQKTLKSMDTSVVKEIKTNDLIVNNHKFNNQLLELNDFKDVNGNTIGGIMLNGTVLVKTYNKYLDKWVLIRRNISTPMFSQRLNIPSAPEQYGLDYSINDDIKTYFINKSKENEENKEE